MPKRLLPMLLTVVLVGCGLYSPTPPDPAPELLEAPPAERPPVPGEMADTDETTDDAPEVTESTDATEAPETHVTSRRIYRPQARATTAGGTVELGLLRTRRYRTSDGKDRVDVQFAFDPGSGVELVSGRPSLVSCVTNDGVERVTTDAARLWTHYPGPSLGRSTIEVGSDSSRLQELVVECTVLRIDESANRVVEGVPAGVSEELPLGGMLVTATGKPSSCTVAVTYGDPALRQEISPGVPLYTHDWCSSALRVTDADGVELYRTGGNGSGAMTMRMYVRPDALGEGHLIADEPAIAYPVRVEFREPLRVTQVPCVFRFTDVELAARE